MDAILKHTHLTALALSFLLFFIRGYLMMRDSSVSKHRAFLIAPHIVNLLLIGSGIALAVIMHFNPANQPWLAWLLLVLFYVIYSEWA